MYAVIFKAEINKLDNSYYKTAKKMKEIAVNEYNCLEFSSCIEDNYEIAISYWPDKESITAWKNNPEHQQAQKQGKRKWYKSYQVQVVEILNQYNNRA